MPSPDLTDEEIDTLMMSPLSDDEFEALLTEAETEAAMALSAEKIEALSTPEPEIETISLTDLLLLGIEPRIGRIADALESVVKIKAAGRNDIVGLTAQVERLANAFEVMAGFVGCVTESVEGKDGVARCYLRTRDDNHSWFLSERDDGED